MDEDPTTLEECDEMLAILNMRLADIMEEQLTLAKEYHDRDKILGDEYWRILAEMTRIEDIKETLQ